MSPKSSLVRALVLAASLAASLSAVTAQNSTLSISEFLASNDWGLRDENNEARDWIEIHNASSRTLDLAGYYLSDSRKNLAKWKFPSPTLIGPDAYLLVFASGKNRRTAGRELHCNFKLSASGEATKRWLALIKPDGKSIVSSFGSQYPPQFLDVSYGLAFNPKLTQELVYHKKPSPGKANGPGDAVILGSKSKPARPTSNDDLVIECELSHPTDHKTSSVAMYWRPGFAKETQLAMRDDGRGGDLVAADEIWTAVLPHTLQAPGMMLRWRFEARVKGPQGQVLVHGPEHRNVKKSPEYYGTLIADTSVKSKLPVLEWFVENPNLARSPQGTYCSLSFAGQFYDHVFVRQRGSSSRDWPKPNYKFDFNPGHFFEHSASEKRVEEINLNSTLADKAFVRQTLAAEVFRELGAPYSDSQPWHLRQNGRFHSVAIYVEQPDGRYLKRHGYDPLGALYKMFNELDIWDNQVEKKTRRWEGTRDLEELVHGLERSGAALEQYVFDKLDLPEILDYLAAGVLMQDSDSLQKNYYLYRDTRGDGRWRILPWDKDLTFGRQYLPLPGQLNDEIRANIDPQSHPLYGDRKHPKIDGFWNSLHDACYRVPRVRAMFLRRLRSSMDKLLQAPGTARSKRYFEGRLDALRKQLTADIALDRSKWGVPGWGNPKFDFASSLGRLEQEYLEPRRKHLYVTHGNPTNGIIPQAQSSASSLQFGTMLADPISGDADEEYIELVNCSSSAIDISGWKLGKGVRFRFAPGTVVAAKDRLWVSPKIEKFLARKRSPHAGQGLFVVGPYAGHLGSSEIVTLEDATGRERSRRGGIDFQITSQGQGDLHVKIQGVPAGTRLFTFMSLQTSGPIGCGPLLGIGLDAAWAASLPQGTKPFHVLADSRGSFTWSAGPGTLPKGLVLDSFVAGILPPFTILFSPVRRLKL